MAKRRKKEFNVDFWGRDDKNKRGLGTCQAIAMKLIRPKLSFSELVKRVYDYKDWEMQVLAYLRKHGFNKNWYCDVDNFKHAKGSYYIAVGDAVDKRYRGVRHAVVGRGHLVWHGCGSDLRIVPDYYLRLVKRRDIEYFESNRKSRKPRRRN